MAKTIKQYAEEYGRNRCKVGCDDFNECFACKESLKCREYYCKVETYVEIATEQRKRDIEKACEEFKFFLDRLVEKDIEALRPEILQADVKVWYEDFKHIMEDKQ